MVRSTSFAAALLSSAAFTTAWWKPSAGDTWNIQLSTTPAVEQADNDAYHVWDMDAVDTPKSTIRAFKQKGKKVMCYFSAGSWENWRDDRHDIPTAAIGKVMDGWENEKWIDTRNAGVRALMKRRIKAAKDQGCDGVDPDNVDGYNNDTGFELTEADGVDYIHFLADAAHDQGLGFGLKNAAEIVDRVIDVSDWCVNESCVEWEECASFQPFICADKPVFHVEYTEAEPVPDRFLNNACTADGTDGFSTLVKRELLTKFTKTCPAAQQSHVRPSSCDD